MTGNPIYDAFIEFLGFIAPIVLVGVVFRGLQILFSSKYFSNPKTK
jgi:hypothetical protein